MCVISFNPAFQYNNSTISLSHFGNENVNITATFQYLRDMHLTDHANIELYMHKEFVFSSHKTALKSQELLLYVEEQKSATTVTYKIYKYSKVKLHLSYCHPPQLRPATIC